MLKAILALVLGTSTLMPILGEHRQTEELGAAALLQCQSDPLVFGSIDAAKSFTVNASSEGQHILEITPNRDLKIILWTIRCDDCTYKLHFGDSITREILRNATNDNKKSPDKGGVVNLKGGEKYKVRIEADMTHNPAYGRWTNLNGKATWNIHENKIGIDWSASPVHGSARIELQG